MTSDEQEIRQLVKTWMQATKSGDIETVLGLMSDDVVFLVAGQPTMIGREAFQAAAQNMGPIQFDGQSEIQEVQVHGDWAFMWTQLKVVANRGGDLPPIIRAGHTLSILRKIDGKWVLARDANLLAAVPG